jgi:tetratricopeptide (TPR) repeat protein
MSYQKQVTATLSVLLAVCLSGAVVLLRPIDQLRTGATLEEVLYIPSPLVLKGLSLGYTGLMADIYWTRAVQYFGGKHQAKSQRYDLLYPLLEITTTLDPQLIVAYQFGSIFLAQKPPEGAGMPEKAVELVERGIATNPKEWRLYYELGFLHYMELHDAKAAAEDFERGAQVPGALPFMRVLAAAMAQHAGEMETARMLWTTTYQTSEDPMIKANALKHLRALRVDQDVPQLEEVARQYQRRTGRTAGSFLDLVSAGLLRGIPVDPLGHPYRLLPDGRVVVEDPDALPFIQQGLPPGHEPTALPVTRQQGKR